MCRHNFVILRKAPTSEYYIIFCEKCEIVKYVSYYEMVKKIGGNDESL